MLSNFAALFQQKACRRSSNSFLLLFSEICAQNSATSWTPGKCLYNVSCYRSNDVIWFRENNRINNHTRILIKGVHSFPCLQPAMLRILASFCLLAIALGVPNNEEVISKIYALSKMSQFFSKINQILDQWSV